MDLQKVAQKFEQGESFWRVILNTGKAYSELDIVDTDPIRGKRPLDWFLDLVATGDVARIAELWLHTPAGDVALKIVEPRTAYIFNSSILQFGRSKVAQIIGRVDDKEQGTGVAFIWDVPMQQIYRDDQASVLDFKAWRPGIVNIGALALDNVGVKL